MNSPLEKVSRTVKYYYYKQKNRWVFPANMAHLTGGKIAKGTYEPQIKCIVEENLKRGDVFLDVGANVGYFSRLASEIVEESGSVYSFEAEPFNYYALCKNTAAQKNVTPFNFAVSNEQKLLSFFKSSHSSSHSIFNSSKNLNGSQFLIPSMTLDYFWLTYLNQAEVNLVKIDVEGAELLVVEGMKKMLSENKINAIILEFHPEIILKAGSDYKTLYSALEKYFNMFLIREKSDKKVGLKSSRHFNQIIKGITEVGKKEKLDIYCKRKFNTSKLN